jgi:hypothetical protein|tara:strand:- start:168 stop:275 length:108 start_codon:yes stop_codon:yes gene_type:complete
MFRIMILMFWKVIAKLLHIKPLKKIIDEVENEKFG